MILQILLLTLKVWNQFDTCTNKELPSTVEVVYILWKICIYFGLDSRRREEVASASVVRTGAVFYVNNNL